MPQLVSVKEYCNRHNLVEMLEEYSHKNVIPADRIGYTSKTEVIWRCKHGHEEIESPFKRFRRGFCKTCGKDRDGSFAQKYPQIAKYWSKDNTVSASEVSPRYSKPVLWECGKGHKWERTILVQLDAATPCPFCRDEDNALFRAYPNMLSEWDTEKNGDVDPFSVSLMSNTKYHWICAEGHPFIASPAERVRRHKGCSICKSFAKKYPDAAAEWHPTKNDFSPYDVSPASNKSAWFVCHNCKEDYLCVIRDRARRKGPYCPHCRNK